VNVRIKFCKLGSLKFIGHLDVMRYFQKAMRRADIPICYSNGHSPHMLMSFAAPLGVGLTSEGEYMDIVVEEVLSSKKAIQQLNAVMADGIYVVSFRSLPENSKNAMSIVAAADYEIRFRKGYELDGWQERFPQLMSRSEILAVKTTKKGQQEINLRPYIYAWSIEGDTLFVKLSSGSVNNIKPEFLMQIFAEKVFNVDLPKFALLIHRKEIYAEQIVDGVHHLISLEELGEEIE